VKKTSVSEWHKWFRGIARTWKMKDVVVQYLTKPMKISKKKMFLMLHSDIHLSIRAIAFNEI
jgi:hypothetical protein